MLDKTGSISSSDLSGERNAATGLLNLYTPLNPHPKVSIGDFGNPGSGSYLGQILFPLTTNYAGVQTAINGITSSGGSTNLQSAIATAQNEFVANGSTHPDGTPYQRILILISDGDPNIPGSGSGWNQGAQDAALSAADQAKLAYTSIFAIHYGSGDGRDRLASLASGTVSNTGHQSGSRNDAGLSNTPTQAQIDAENGDNDYFYISPTAAQLQTLFTQIGSIVCPASVGGGAPALPPTSISTGSWQEVPTAP
jgi:hypothetical protein